LHEGSPAFAVQVILHMGSEGMEGRWVGTDVFYLAMVRTPWREAHHARNATGAQRYGAKGA